MENKTDQEIAIHEMLEHFEDPWEFTDLLHKVQDYFFLEVNDVYTRNALLGLEGAVTKYLRDAKKADGK